MAKFSVTYAAKLGTLKGVVEAADADTARKILDDANVKPFVTRQKKAKGEAATAAPAATPAKATK